MRRYLLLLPVVALFAGCGVLQLFWPQAETGSAKLMPFESEADLVEYFTGQVTQRNERLLDLANTPGFRDDIVLGVDLDAGAGALQEGAAPPAAPGGEGGDGGDSSGSFFSETTTQEAGVAEADLVKTDGTYLYIIDEQTLRIVRATPADSLAIIGEVPLEGYGRDIYLHDGKVVALTSTYGGFYGGGFIGVEPGIDTVAVDEDRPAEGEAGAEPVAPEETAVAQESIAPPYERPKTIVTVIDVSTPDAPEVLSTTRFEGSQSSSRMIDGVLYMVVSNFQVYYVDVFPLLGQNELDVEAVDVTPEMILPGYDREDGDGTVTEGEVLTWEDVFHPEDPDGYGVVSIISLDVDNGAEFSATGIVAEPGEIYSSPQALYLTDTAYNFFGDMRETTDIHKFAYADRTANLVASGSVPGRVLNQYSMGEHQGFLRLATTVSGFFFFDGPVRESVNNVYVLAQEGDALNLVGSVENIAPRETIQAARFVGDRGYVVTFEQIDPLFTLDLSDPTHPRIAGELKVPGFSTFLVPMGEDHLLAVGRYIPEPGVFGPWGVQLSIFDVSDFRDSDPELAHQVILGQQGGAYSEALHDPKAFAYFPQGGTLALPASIYNQEIIFMDEPPPDGAVGNGAGSDAGTDTGAEDTEPTPPTPDEPVDPDVVDAPMPEMFEGLIVYEVSTETGFAEMKRISTQYERAYYSAFTRGVFIDDYVFAVTNNGVRGAPVDGADQPLVELLFPQDDGDIVVFETRSSAVSPPATR